MKIPIDLQEQREKYEKMGLGTCGPSVIALLFNKNVCPVIRQWKGGYKGYAPLGQVKKELEIYSDQKAKMIGGKKSKKFETPDGYWMAIARIQWEGNWGHWIEAQKHTHYILLQGWDAGPRVFCNSIGWFHWSERKGYLKKGHITSFLVIDDWKMAKPPKL